MRFNAVLDQVIVEPEEDNEMKQSSGGIFIPNAEKSDIQFGKVMAFGKGTDKYKNRDGSKLDLELKVGDRIGFKKIQASNIEVFNKKYKLIEFASIVGIFDNSNDVDSTSIIIED